MWWSNIIPNIPHLWSVMLSSVKQLYYPFLLDDTFLLKWLTLVGKVVSMSDDNHVFSEQKLSKLVQSLSCSFFFYTKTNNVRELGCCSTVNSGEMAWSKNKLTTWDASFVLAVSTLTHYLNSLSFSCFIWRHEWWYISHIISCIIKHKEGS